MAIQGAETAYAILAHCRIKATLDFAWNHPLTAFRNPRRPAELSAEFFRGWPLLSEIPEKPPPAFCEDFGEIMGCWQLPGVNKRQHGGGAEVRFGEVVTLRFVTMAPLQISSFF